MRDDLDRRRYDDPNDPYPQDTQPIPGRIEPERVDYVDDRYSEPAPVRERYVEERYTEPAEDRYADRRPTRSRTQTLARYARVIYFVFGVLESLIAIRAILRLLGANPASGFANLIYRLTGPFVAPFKGLFAEPSLGASGFGDPTLELSSIVAIIVYALLTYALVRLIYLFAD